jgi:type IV secretory pathway component VirB8
VDKTNLQRCQQIDKTQTIYYVHGEAYFDVERRLLTVIIMNIKMMIKTIMIAVTTLAIMTPVEEEEDWAASGTTQH